MSILSHHHRHNQLGSFALRSIVAALVFSLIFCPSISYAQQATVLGLPRPGVMVDLSPAYMPVIIKGLRVHPDNPLAMDFIVDTGNTGLKADQSADKDILSKESEKLIKYFLAALTLPEKDVWVNLSPYEKDKIIPTELGQTEMGRDMLAQDYILKQITASLIYPEKRLGKDFWDKVYAQASQRFGTTQIPVNTFNKVWIVADKATVYENKDTAFVVNEHLKVMLEQDYLSLEKHQATASNTNDIGSQVVREIVLPALEQEVNTGKNFANLRQIFYSLILAKWYKQALKQSFLNQVYSNKNKVVGVDVSDKTITRKIYAQYLRAYKKGVFNFIKEDIDQTTQQPLPRKYFSGGVVGDVAMTVTRDPAMANEADQPIGEFALVGSSFVENKGPLDESGYAPAHLLLTEDEVKARRLFDTSFSAETHVINLRTSTFAEKVANLNRIEQKFYIFTENAALNKIKKEASLIDKTTIHKILGAMNYEYYLAAPWQTYMRSVLREYLAGAHKERMEVIHKYLLLKQASDNLITQHGPVAPSHVYSFILGYYNEQLRKDADYEQKQRVAEERQKEVEAEFAEKRKVTQDRAMNAEFSWEDPKKVEGFIKENLQQSLEQPFELNPGQSDVHFVQSFPGIHSWQEMSWIANEAAKGDTSKARILGGFINLSNARPWLKDDKFNSLEPAKERYMTEFTTTQSNVEALESLKKGEFFIEILAGGAAERAKDSLKKLGLELPDSFYRIWNIKLWDIIREAQEGNLTPKTDESKKLLEVIKQVTIPDNSKNYTIGERLLYAISKGIDDLPVTKEEKVQIRDNLKIVIHVNDDILDNVVNDLKEFKFFGLKPSNILLVNGGYGPAFKITNTGLEEEKGVKTTWNHLFAFMENKWKKDGVYTFTDDTKEHVETHNTVDHFLHERGAKYGLIRRVNDAILLDPEGAMDVQFFSAFLGARKTANANVLYQVMPNTASNKGGLAVTMPGINGFSFPYEGLDSQSFKVLQKLNGMSATPYNRLYMMYDLESVNEATNNNKIPLSLKIKETDTGHGKVFLVSPESPIGNLLLVPGIHGLAVQRSDDLLFRKKILIPQAYEGQYTPGYEGHKPGERIHDIKTVTDFIKVLAPIYASMDRELNVEAFVAEFRNHYSVSNKAMTTGRAPVMNSNVAPGGIDLNADRMQLNIKKEGSGVGINFDPAMIKRFESGDFQGFMPIIINIRPITNIAQMLGLKEEEPELSNV